MIEIRFAEFPGSGVLVQISGLSIGQRMLVHEAAQDIRWSGWRKHKATADAIAMSLVSETVQTVCPRDVMLSEFVLAIKDAIERTGVDSQAIKIVHGELPIACTISSAPVDRAKQTGATV